MSVVVPAKLKVPCPSNQLLEYAKAVTAWDLGAKFEQTLVTDSSTNLTIPQAMQQFMLLCKHYESKPGLKELGAKLKMNAKPFFMLNVSTEDASEMVEFWDMTSTGDDKKVVLSGPGAEAQMEEEKKKAEALKAQIVEDLKKAHVDGMAEASEQEKRVEEETIKTKQENLYVETVYYYMRLAIRRHGKGKSLIDYYFSCVDSLNCKPMLFMMNHFLQQKRKTALIVCCKALMAHALVRSNPESLELRYNDAADEAAMLDEMKDFDPQNVGDYITKGFEYAVIAASATAKGTRMVKEAVAKELAVKEAVAKELAKIPDDFQPERPQMGKLIAAPASAQLHGS